MIVKLSILIAFSLLLLVPTGYSFADDKEDKKEKKIKTLESECGKKLDKEKLNFDGLMCQAVFELQSKVDTFVVDITINWIDIVGIPEDIADGDDDTHLTEAEVDAFVSNNGFSTEPHTVDTDTLYSGVDFATSNQNCAIGNVVSGIDENGIITCVLDQTGTGGDTTALDARIAFLESISNNPPTITDFELIVDNVVTPNSFGTSYIHDCTINWSYTIHDDQRWLPLTAHHFVDNRSDDDFERTVQQESLSATTEIFGFYNYEYLNLSPDYTKSRTLSVTVDDGGASAIIIQDFRC